MSTVASNTLISLGVILIMVPTDLDLESQLGTHIGLSDSIQTCFREFARMHRMVWSHRTVIDRKKAHPSRSSEPPRPYPSARALPHA